MESKRITKHIDRLLLDPNNYRFIDKSEYRIVPDGQVSDDRIQQRTFNFIAGKSNENISDLIISFKTNGFLDIDQIQVKAVGDKYLVLEGNRRAATLKFLYEEFKRGNDVGKLTESDFKSINIVEITEEDPARHLITMGLHHISGKKRWSAVNESQLVSDLLNKYDKTEDEICNSLGITRQKFRRNLRTLSLIGQYKDSDFGDQFKTEMYTIFETVIENPVMKGWIGWNDADYNASNTVNRERFFSWISQTEEIEINDSGVEHPVIKEPIISQYRQIKELAAFINDEKAVERMEKSRSITEGYTLSDEVGETKLKNALSNIKTDVQAVFNFSEYMTNEDFSEVSKLKDKLDKLTPASFAAIKINEKNTARYFRNVHKHFESVSIIQYRKLYGINIKHLSHINIFAGGNNLGKTSILESLYLLSQLNDMNALFELERYRGKFYNEFQSKWLDKNIADRIEISGIFNGVTSDICIQKEDTTENIDKTDYLSTIKVEARVNGTDLDSSVHLYGNREPDLRYAKTQILCQGSFTSPYRYNIDLLSRAHNHAIREKYFDDIVDFIREQMDSSIEKIDLVENNRFMVTSNKLDTAIDITKYGEGMQRVFEIALLMGYNANGILCVDEIDCAIHHSLLVNFSKFLQQLADRFGVQVFLSTHSKECIDAFIEAKYNDNKNITAYSLTDEAGKITCKYVNGERLESLIQSVNFDIR
ncbi:MAG: AAA family ATPase [Prevotellaceae bacterium]|jgi:AAA15 family ATPase/GTPase|nr:AAA family ATPase [Prevotellaceae bacterium]